MVVLLGPGDESSGIHNATGMPERRGPLRPSARPRERDGHGGMGMALPPAPSCFPLAPWQPISNRPAGTRPIGNRPPQGSREEALNHLAVDVRQAEVAPRVAVRQLLV